MDFATALISFLNIGLFSAIVSRFTGANIAMIVFCAILYVGGKPLETIGMMITYLLFTRLTIYTQNQKINFKRMNVFTGWRIIPPVVLIVLFLFIYPFVSLAVFFLFFMLEILSGMRKTMLPERKMTNGELLPYIVSGSVVLTIGMILAAFIPESIYYIAGGAVILIICAFFWWLGNDRDRLQTVWDRVVIASFFPVGLFGFDLADWLADMKRNVNRTHITYNLPFVFLPVFFVGFIMAHLLFGIFSLGGMVITLFTAIGMRLFGYYEMSGRGRTNLVALAVTAFAALMLFLTAPEPTGASQAIDAFLPQEYYGFKGIFSLL